MARQEQKRARERICTLVQPGTVLALPTAPCIAPRIDTGAEALESFRVRVMRLTCLAGLSGLPQVTLPVGSVSGCPVGLSFIAWHGGDEALLDLAVQLARYVVGGMLSACVAKGSACVFSRGIAGPAAVGLCLPVSFSAGCVLPAGEDVSVLRMIGRPSFPLPMMTTFAFVDCES